MRLYLDANVIDYIAGTDELRAACRLFQSRSSTVIASEIHLQELLAIPQKRRRQKQLRVLTKSATHFAQKPVTWHHAREVRLEAARCRGAWMKTAVLAGSVKQHLRNHKALWSNAQLGLEPAEASQRRYYQDAQNGIKTATRFQKEARGLKAGKRKPRTLTSEWTFDGVTRQTSLDDPENYWRHDAAEAWYEAIALGNPASRDYADFLGPYLNAGAFDDTSYYKFWMEDVDGSLVPRNRLTGLAAFFQLQKKVTHGNPFDTLHANFMLEVDQFFTADKDFYHVLMSIRRHLGDDCAVPVLLVRAEPSAVDQLEALVTK